MGRQRMCQLCKAKPVMSTKRFAKYCSKSCANKVACRRYYYRNPKDSQDERRICKRASCGQPIPAGKRCVAIYCSRACMKADIDDRRAIRREQWKHSDISPAAIAVLLAKGDAALRRNRCNLGRAA